MWPIFRPRRASRLAVQMQLHVVEAGGGRPVRLAVRPELAEQIGHRRRGRQQLRGSQRQRADRAHLLLELARDRGVERQVAGVVRPRRDLVDEQFAVGVDEELDAQDADVLQLFENVRA